MFGAVEGGALRVRLPDYDGSFYIDARSDILRRVLTSGYESELARIVKDSLEPDRDAIDVGANVGFFSVLIAKHLHRGKRTLAIEPTPLALEKLRANVALNAVDNILIFEGVASDRCGQQTLKMIDGLEEYSSLGEMLHPSIRGRTFKEIEVRAETIDSLVDRFAIAPGLMKIDVEGAEASVLRGCKRTLNKYGPTIICEVWGEDIDPDFQRRRKEVLEILQGSGYRVLASTESEIFAIRS